MVWDEGLHVARSFTARLDKVTSTCLFEAMSPLMSPIIATRSDKSVNDLAVSEKPACGLRHPFVRPNKVRG